MNKAPSHTDTKLSPMQELIESITQWENTFKDANRHDRFFQGAFSRCANIKSKAQELQANEQAYWLSKQGGEGVDTIGKLLTEAIHTIELDIDIFESEMGLLKGVLQKLMNDEYYTNCIPLMLFKNLILSLEIPFEKVEAAMIPTFKMIVSKETPESLKKKPHGYTLWENQESVIKYTNRLKELMHEYAATVAGEQGKGG